MILTTISDAASAFVFGVFAKIKESQRAKIGSEKIMVLRMSLRKLAVLCVCFHEFRFSVRFFIGSSPLAQLRIFALFSLVVKYT